MLGFDTLTLIVIGATVITAFVLWVTILLASADDGAEIAGIVALIFGILLTAEVIYLIVRFVKFVWLL